MSAIQALFIRGYEERPTPKPHTVYRIDIQAHVRSWQMWRRYSEFDDLHTELTKSTGSSPPASLPPKHKLSLFRSHADTKLLEERRAALETYLRAILSAKEDKWRESFAFREFLGIPTGKQVGLQGAPSAQFTSASWLDEHLELQARLRDVWAEINKRDALSERGDVAESHKCNVTAKSKLAGVLSRIGILGKGLQELGMGGMSEGELQRRTDMVARLQDDCEKLSRVVTVARQSSSRAGGGAAIGVASINPASESDREALLGAGGLKPARRVFGASVQPVETETTRPLDNVGLFGLQQMQMQQQDNQLSQLTTILQRQRQLGEAIGNEVAQQIEMLDGLSNDVDHVGTKLTKAKVQLNRLG
ncbi:syntaxin [Crucibulum laeve]|uniref:Syntaxin n=1 Tax=Crucibulum laeve TaxID=68775 RepID=A0A5C3M6R9_9AGAR|nr:syntaxin [Crucibulum laeve]